MHGSEKFSNLPKITCWQMVKPGCEPQQFDPKVQILSAHKNDGERKGWYRLQSSDFTIPWELALAIAKRSITSFSLVFISLEQRLF